MAVSQNKLLPVLGFVGVVIVGTILYQQFAGDKPVSAGAPLAAIPAPTPLPKATGADGDNASETLATVVASNRDLRDEVNKVLENNRRLQEENDRIKRSQGSGLAAPPPAAPSVASAPPATQAAPATPRSGFEVALETAGQAAEQIMAVLPSDDGTRRPTTSTAGAVPSPGARSRPPAHQARNSEELMPEAPGAGLPPGMVRYAARAPMGYALVEEKGNGRGAGQVRYVRTLAADSLDQAPPATGAAAAAARAAKPEDVPYFTLPENGTLTGVRAMTSIVGRVPIDGRVTDPMQFKAMIGRDNLAANGWELPPDLAGIIVTGVAIGDMALSCSEGKLRSLTFVFNDGSIRTVSSRARTGGGNGSSSGGGGDLGFLSDAHGNPCIPGKFVTNAPAFLADMVGLRTLGVASQAYAEAQRKVTETASGGQTSQVNDPNRYAMGQAVNGATDEVTKWLMSRLKNSFDAVVTPAGAELDNLVVHLDQEIRLDKATDGRRLVHRLQASAQNQRGAHHGLE